MKLDLGRNLWSSFVAIGLLIGLTTSCSGEPSFDEASQELADLIDPAVKAAFSESDVRPRRVEDSGECSDPFFGPSQGLRPELTYELPLSTLGDPQVFISSVEKAWKAKGLEVRSDDDDVVLSRSVSKGAYRARALINFTNQQAVIGGSGPCVDDPNAD